MSDEPLRDFHEERQRLKEKGIAWYMNRADERHIDRFGGSVWDDVVQWCDAADELAVVLWLVHNKFMADGWDRLVEIKDRLLRNAAVRHAEKVCD